MFIKCLGHQWAASRKITIFHYFFNAFSANLVTKQYAEIKTVFKVIWQSSCHSSRWWMHSHANTEHICCHVDVVLVASCHRLWRAPRLDESIIQEMPSSRDDRPMFVLPKSTSLRGRSGPPFYRWVNTSLPQNRNWLTIIQLFLYSIPVCPNAF